MTPSCILVLPFRVQTTLRAGAAPRAGGRFASALFYLSFLVLAALWWASLTEALPFMSMPQGLAAPAGVSAETAQDYGNSAAAVQGCGINPFGSVSRAVTVAGIAMVAGAGGTLTTWHPVASALLANL
eukprot:CAMPEP_0178428430 /NCGR_PEP_ID=MMETSP0689_2-20121128/30274_1 /TAXON_ID=160604 /ORGANISM="Amphidinium massartii, Strain CS-259" /LENGTH=127 /DNA_ID=CAMNT_0020050203 /DNA_START=76 /DNA_END=459 /DNA_ORIENTATION=+